MNLTPKQKEFLIKFFQLMSEYNSDILYTSEGIYIKVDDVNIGIYEDLTGNFINLASGGN